jgi:uncharacterized membrane protein
MRLGMVIVGVIVVIIGAVLLFVPLVPQTSQTVASNSSTPFYLGSVSGFSLTGNIAVAVSWTSTTTVTIAAAACSGTCSNISQISGITTQSGTSGSFTLNQPDGGEVIMGIVTSGGAAANATFKITTALATVGSILVIVGIVILIAGIVLHRKKPAAEPAPAPTPAYDSSQTQMQPPSS